MAHAPVYAGALFSPALQIFHVRGTFHQLRYGHAVFILSSYGRKLKLSSGTHRPGRAGGVWKDIPFLFCSFMAYSEKAANTVRMGGFHNAIRLRPRILVIAMQA